MDFNAMRIAHCQSHQLCPCVYLSVDVQCSRLARICVCAIAFYMCAHGSHIIMVSIIDDCSPWMNHHLKYIRYMPVQANMTELFFLVGAVAFIAPFKLANLRSFINNLHSVWLSNVSFLTKIELKFRMGSHGCLFYQRI